MRRSRALRELEEAAEKLGLPCVLKTVTGGYDGKGQRVIRDHAQIASAYERFSGRWSRAGA